MEILDEESQILFGLLLGATYDLSSQTSVVLLIEVVGMSARQFECIVCI